MKYLNEKGQEISLLQKEKYRELKKLHDEEFEQEVEEA